MCLFINIHGYNRLYKLCSYIYVDIYISTPKYYHYVFTSNYKIYEIFIYVILFSHRCQLHLSFPWLLAAHSYYMHLLIGLSLSCHTT